MKIPIEVYDNPFWRQWEILENYLENKTGETRRNFTVPSEKTTLIKKTTYRDGSTLEMHECSLAYIGPDPDRTGFDLITRRMNGKLIGRVRVTWWGQIIETETADGITDIYPYQKEEWEQS